MITALQTKVSCLGGGPSNDVVAFVCPGSESEAEGRTETIIYDVLASVLSAVAWGILLVLFISESQCLDEKLTRRLGLILKRICENH